ncbi:MAG: flagellar hook capping FlgD N-terminal domain-containing protein [Thermodesulfobacteriota bacterium]
MIDTTSTLAATSSSSTSTSTALTSATNSTMGKEDFLQLLITQLQNQDPLNPEDPKDFVAQLAQFTSLEQQINTNSNLENLSKSLGTLKNAYEMAEGVSMLGKTVKGVGNTITVASGQATSASYNLAKAAKEVTVTIANSSGTVVRTLNLGSLAAGDQTLAWDGKNSSGTTVADGTYTFTVTAKDSAGQSIDVTNYYTGVVQEVYMDSTGIWVKVGDRQMLLENIVSITP